MNGVGSRAGCGPRSCSVRMDAVPTAARGLFSGSLFSIIARLLRFASKGRTPTIRSVSQRFAGPAISGRPAGSERDRPHQTTGRGTSEFCGAPARQGSRAAGALTPAVEQNATNTRPLRRPVPANSATEKPRRRRRARREHVSSGERVVPFMHPVHGARIRVHSSLISWGDSCGRQGLGSY